VVLDIACSVVAGSRLSQTGSTKGELPRDWALDESGEVTTDPASVYSYLPIGGHKGYGIAFVNEVPAGVLSGSLFGTDLPSRQSLNSVSWDVGHQLLAVDPCELSDGDEFYDRMDRLAAMVGRSRLRNGFDPVVLPGENEYRARERHRSSGIMLPGPLVQELLELCNK
jgi:LDH2 family malate/lactate/ureidoglycolate dehydrogenase